jgi:hypothetical protein
MSGMNLELFESYLLDEKNAVISGEMQRLCMDATAMTSEDVRERAMVIDKSAQYAESIIVNAIEKLKGE